MKFNPWYDESIRTNTILKNPFESKLIILPRSHRGQFTKKLISLMKKVMRGQGD